MDRKKLEHRFERFGIEVLRLAKQLEKNDITDHLKSQIIRSGISPALNYAEAGDAESLKDFIHKLKIALKELRETQSMLRIIQGSELYQSKAHLDKMIKENGELIAILISSIKTSKQNAGIQR